MFCLPNRPTKNVIMVALGMPLYSHSQPKTPSPRRGRRLAMEAQQQQGRIPARKRKGRDGAAGGSPDAAPGAGSRLLAGYLAHEFLTAGTVLGSGSPRAPRRRRAAAAGTRPWRRWCTAAGARSRRGEPAQLAAWVRT